MINVSIVRDKKKFIWEFTVEGHAGCGKHGQDIVCSAVSAVVYTAIGALDEMLGINNYSEKAGYINCSLPVDIPDNKKETASVILEAMLIGLKQIREMYRPEYKRFLSIVEEEV